MTIGVEEDADAVMVTNIKVVKKINGKRILFTNPTSCCKFKELSMRIC
jgi:hypothetical protein